MANVFEYASVFQSELDKGAVEQATSGWMELNDKLVRYNGGADVKIPSMDMDGLADYDRDKGFVEGSVNLKWETKTMTQDRGRQFTFDENEVNETNFVVTAAQVMGEFQRTKVIPEIDAYRYSKIASLCIDKDRAGYEYTPTESDILQKLYYDIAGNHDGPTRGGHLRYVQHPVQEPERDGLQAGRCHGEGKEPEWRASYPARGQRSYEDQLYLQRRNHGRSGEGRLYSCGGSPGHQLDHLPPHGPHRRIPHGQGADLRPGDLSEEAGLGDGLPQVPRPGGAGQQAGGHVGKHQAGQGWRWRLRGGLIMITLKRLNEVRQVASEERAAKLEKKGFARIGGAAEEESRPVTKADLEKLGDALLDRLKAESKGGTKKGGKPKEEPDGSGTGEPDSGDGEK